MNRLLRSRRSMLVAPVVLAGLAIPATATATAPASCGTAGITTTPVHGSTFYVDRTRTRHLDSAYAGFTIASSTARSSLWLSIDSTSGGKLAKAAGQPAAEPVAAVTPTAPTVAFVYLTASGTTSAAQTVTYSLWSGQPGSAGTTKVCTFTDTYARVKKTLQASANKVTSVVVSNPTPNVGDTVTVTVKGRTGTIGAGPSYDAGVFNASLSKYANWPAGSLRVVGTSLSISTTATGQPTTYTNRLHVNNLRGRTRNYTLTYTVHVDAALGHVYRVAPVQDIASGRNVKHTKLRRSSIATIGTGTPAEGDDNDPDVLDDTVANGNNGSNGQDDQSADDSGNGNGQDDQSADDSGSDAGQDDNGDGESGDQSGNDGESAGTGPNFAILDAGFGAGATCPATLNEDRSPAVTLDDVEEYDVATELYRSNFGHDIAGWQELSGHWIAENSTLTQRDSCGFDYTALLTTHAVSDFTLETTFHAEAANQGGIVFNQSSSATRSGASVVDLTDGGSVLRWGHYNNAGYYTYEGSQPIATVTSGQQVTVKVEVHTTSATVFLNGSQVATMSNQNPAGYVGVLTNQSKVNFDSVVLTGLPGISA